MNGSSSHQTPQLDRLIDRMDARLGLLVETGDPRARFLLMYRTFKQELRQNLQAGRFLDRAWAEAICCRMAEMYFEAEEAYQDCRAACPAPWTYSFDGATQGSTNLLQDMLLGMNAHINYDLPLCTFDTLVKFDDLRGLSPIRRDAKELPFDATLRKRYFDFLMINHIAWESIERIQDVACARFSKPLWALVKLERMARLRLSKKITATVILDYRDRAWGHTLLLATATSPEQIERVKWFTTRFAMEAATLVDLLDRQPRRLARAVRRKRGLGLDPFRHRQVVRFLVDKLRERSTAKVAARALIDYGTEIHPLLEELLEEYAADTTLAVRLMEIMAATPTPAVAAVLYNRFAAAHEATDETLVHLLASLRLNRVRFVVDERPLREALEEAVGRARWIAECRADLGDGGRESLLADTLKDRARKQIRRILLLGTILQPDPTLFTAAEALARKRDADPPQALSRLLDSVVPGVGEEIIRGLLVGPADEGMGPASRHPAVERQSRERRLAELVGTVDPWLRACALHQIRELRLSDLSAPLIAALDAESALVAETALWACEGLLPPSRFSSVARACLERTGQEIVQQYARSLLAGEDSGGRMLSTIEKVLHLKDVDLFIAIPAEDLAEIAQVAQEQPVRQGQQLLTAGSPGEGLYVIVEGEVDVVGEDGRQLARVHPGAVLGEMSLLLDAPCSATCVASSTGRVLRIGRSDFQAFMLGYPEIALGLLRVLADRLREANAKIVGPVSNLVSQRG